MPLLPQLILCTAYDDFQPAPKKLACILPPPQPTHLSSGPHPTSPESEIVFGVHFSPLVPGLDSCNWAEKYSCLIAFSLAFEISTNHIILSNILAFESPRESPQGLKVTTGYTNKGKKKILFFYDPWIREPLWGMGGKAQLWVHSPSCEDDGGWGRGHLYLPWTLIRKNHRSSPLLGQNLLKSVS